MMSIQKVRRLMRFLIKLSHYKLNSNYRRFVFTLISKKYSRLYRFIRYTLLDLRYGSGYLGKKLTNFGLGDDSRGWHGAQSSDYDALGKFLVIFVCIQKI